MAAIDHPWKLVPVSLIVHQLGRMTGLGGRRAATDSGAATSTGAAPAASRLGVPVNLFDAMRVVLRKPEAP